jgi:uncharacterized membrane protein
MWTKFRDNFIAGIAVIFPSIITWWLVVLLYRVLNNWFLNPVIKYFKPYLIHVYLEYGARTLLFLLLVAIVMLIGLATRVLFLKKIFSAGEKMFFKMPMIGRIYVATKQMSKALFGEHKGIFKSPVLVEYPRKGLYSIGFITGFIDSGSKNGKIHQKIDKKLVNLYVPTTPNPATGMLLLVPEDELITLDMSIEEAMKLVISGGIVTPDGSRKNQVEIL